MHFTLFTLLVKIVARVIGPLLCMRPANLQTPLAEPGDRLLVPETPIH
jgi:hypothetical protein